MDRPGRSWYLDDMCPPDGSMVVCKAAILSHGITVGKSYVVSSKPAPDGGVYKGIINDHGRWVIPSARFQKCEQLESNHA